MGGVGGPGDSTSRDSFDRPPSELEAYGSTGERPPAEELAAMVANLKVRGPGPVWFGEEEMSGGGEELLISEVLGAGAYGVVYRGFWKGLSVAVKTLRFSDRMYGNERARKSALKEAAICCSLHHPNVVSTYTYELKPVRVLLVDEPSRAEARGEQGAGTSGGAAASSGSGGGGGSRRGCDSGPGPGGVDAGSGPGGLRITAPEVREWKLFLIQEFCAGGTLRQLVDRGALMWGNSDMPLMQKVLAMAVEASGASPTPPTRPLLERAFPGNPLCTVDPSALRWSPQLPPEYVQLGRACLARQPEQRPGFPAIVRQLLAQQSAVDAEVAEAAARSAKRAVEAAGAEAREGGGRGRGGGSERASGGGVAGAGGEGSLGGVSGSGSGRGP
ncbi:hypothetical protein GPECTOR_2g977 [Gonium pectorale]|uniref:Protein kinase domain-containing protein n=1 Tax=Gonium pectorale TaxID=33097 RepID=A0A150H214_GONPE|nr:hypothetical protein GPECTOR_2g977 [Gonium pectorale]|eukprot:KXZ56095.1 hypothetical protein GPECTOR_2g977 [Gonium pectorale]